MLGLKSIKYFYRHGVKKVAIQFNEWQKTTYRWRARYQGLYYVLQKLGIYEKASSKVNEKEQKKYKQHVQEKKYKYC